MSTIYLSAEVPAPGMSRYQFTRPGGYHVITVEARTALEARQVAVSRSGRSDLICTHLSDYHSMTPAPAMPDPEDMYGYLFP